MNELERYKVRQHRIFGEFLHEIKTPLAIMRTHLESEISNESIPMDTRVKLVQDIEEIARMNTLINDVKFLLEDISPNEKEQFTQENLLEIVMDVVEMMEPMAQTKAIKLSLTCSDIINILVHKNRLKQLFVNLINNAIKYTPSSGSVNINITKEHNNVIVKITDSGIGIAAEYIEKIFEPFFQIQAHTSEGVGLGLALCKNICDMHNATIEVESTLEQGCSFIVTFKDLLC